MVAAFGCVKFYALTARMDDRFEQRTIIKFLVKECVSATDIFVSLQAVFGESCLSRTQVFEWVKRFKEGRDSLNGNARPGRPTLCYIPFTFLINFLHEKRVYLSIMLSKQEFYSTTKDNADDTCGERIKYQNYFIRGTSKSSVSPHVRIKIVH